MEQQVIRKPETISEARRWERVYNNYLRLSLCFICAAQAAWGHQNGFKSIKDPCKSCRKIVRTLPVQKSETWNGLVRGTQLIV